MCVWACTGPNVVGLAQVPTQGYRMKLWEMNICVSFFVFVSLFCSEMCLLLFLWVSSPVCPTCVPLLLQEGEEVSKHNCQQHDSGVQCLQWIVFLCVCVQAISAFWGLCITLGGSPSLAQTLHHLAEQAMSSSTLTSEVVSKLLTQYVSQQTILSAQDHNLFGVHAEDALEEAKKNIPLLKAIFLEHAYPKLTVLEAGFRQWATPVYRGFSLLWALCFFGKASLGGGNFWMCLYTSCCFTHTEVTHRHTPPSCKLVIACPNIMLAPTSRVWCWAQSWHCFSRKKLNEWLACCFVLERTRAELACCSSLPSLIAKFKSTCALSLHHYHAVMLATSRVWWPTHCVILLWQAPSSLLAPAWSFFVVCVTHLSLMTARLWQAECGDQPIVSYCSDKFLQPC